MTALDEKIYNEALDLPTEERFLLKSAKSSANDAPVPFICKAGTF